MDLINLLNKNKILDKNFIIDYDLFFNKNVEEYFKFVLDEKNDIKKLNNVLSYIKNIDKNTKIYVDTYNLDFINKKPFIYADTLWINTNVDLHIIYNYFNNIKCIEPSYIGLLIDDKIDYKNEKLVILLNNKIEEYSLFIKDKKLDKIKVLYWN